MYPLIYFTPEIYIPTYFLVISIAYMAGLFFLLKRADKRQLSKAFALDISLIIMIGGFLGARIFHVFYENFEFYAQYPMEAFKVWNGGFVFYGGFFGALIPSLIFAQIKKQNISQWLDVFAPIAALGYMIGRLATLLSGSGYGKPTDLPWGIIYPKGTEAPFGMALHPTPIYSCLWELFILVLILVIERAGRRGLWKAPGALFYSFIIWHSLGRAFIEQFRDDFRGELVWGLTVSTQLSFVVALIAMGLWVAKIVRQPK